MTQENVELIVAAVNTYNPTTEAATNQKFDWGEVFGPFIYPCSQGAWGFCVPMKWKAPEIRVRISSW